ncbi:hypothetical protein EGR_05206 [Echinococcus granulosus]|uniref:Uncharacterized protein n=1 Tax=Echinococcus granulosus TaxID=6210 RepID=W6UEK6_ECHGR|nr:hypothetical protein EGR_05206 [Echinococcus granulosus]EUB59880.1 hypothetical protein EGR_05206 [Echinococcus granulosus]
MSNDVIIKIVFTFSTIKYLCTYASYHSSHGGCSINFFRTKLNIEVNNLHSKNTHYPGTNRISAGSGFNEDVLSSGGFYNFREPMDFTLH